jgi:hypothetical protein
MRGRGRSRPSTTITTDDRTAPIIPGRGLATYNAAIRRLRELGLRREAGRMRDELERVTINIVGAYVNVEGIPEEEAGTWPDLSADD